MNSNQSSEQSTKLICGCRETIWSLLLLLLFTESRSKPKKKKIMLRIYVWELGDDRSSALRGGGFSSALEPRGWTAPQPRLISSFSTLFSLIWSELSLSGAQRWAERGGFQCHSVAFSQRRFHIMCLICVSAAAVEASLRYNCQTDISSRTICESYLTLWVASERRTFQSAPLCSSNSPLLSVNAEASGLEENLFYSYHLVAVERDGKYIYCKNWYFKSSGSKSPVQDQDL